MRFAAWRRPALAFVLAAMGAGTLPLPAQPDAIGKSLLQQAERAHDSEHIQAERYLVLVVLDGFGLNYAQREKPAHLQSLASHGAWAPEGMLPSYPALGIPNRFTIVTGLYPGHHGLVADSFFDPDRKARFSADQASTLAESAWYGGTPLWSLAERQGMRTAVVGWPGAQAEIAGFRPTYSVRSGSAGETREILEQTSKWLHLAAEKRPHFIAIDYPEPAGTARRYGPDAPETRAAAQRADEFAGRLKAELDRSGLPVDLVVVSDRGLAKTQGSWITLDQFTSLSGFLTDGPLLYGTDEQQRERVYRQLNHVSSLFVVYRGKDLPPNSHMRMNSRAGDPVVMATGAYAIRARGPATGEKDLPPPPAIDGLDPRAPEMRAIFFAVGPDVVPGKTVAAFENVNLYPWIAHILGLKAQKSDGNLNILAGILRDDGAESAGGPTK